jgi:hypothetical protein
LKVLKEVLKLEGSNLKVKLKLKCLKGIPEDGVPEGPREWGSVQVERMVALVVCEGCSALQKSDFDSCSGGSKG